MTRPVHPVHVVVPAGIDDPARPSGGNVYDRRLVGGLRALGRSVEEHPVAGGWPHPRPAEEDVFGTLLDGLPDGAVVVVDGLVASAAARVLPPSSERLRIVVLLHMPLAEAVPGDGVPEAERRVLAAADAVITPSRWARDWVITHHRLPVDRVHVAEPGVDPVAPAVPSSTGGRVLCLAAVTPAKGHDVLLAALARIADLDWRCTCVGALDLEPAFVEKLRADARRTGVADRVGFTGPMVGAGLSDALGAADLLVSASRRESYGMAVIDALARAVPVVVSAVGGHPEAVGGASDDSLAGVLVPPDDPGRLAEVLRSWLTDRDVRERMRRAAAERRRTLRPWTGTAARVGEVLDAVAVNRPRRPLVLPSTRGTTG